MESNKENKEEIYKRLIKLEKEVEKIADAHDKIEAIKNLL